MIKYFELQLELLEIQKKEDYIKIAKIIEKYPQRDFKFYHQYAFLFEGYKKLINGEIFEDEFTTLGDFHSQSLFNVQKKDSISYLKSNPNLDSNIIYVFDSLAQGIVEESKNIFYC